MTTTGGRLVVDTLVAHGLTTGFGVPGESYLPVLDALYDLQDRFRLITTRHEGAAAFMAEAWGKLTGEPGVCLVTRGPGATNAAIGVHTAAQDSSPMLLLVGQVPTAHRGREAFQEMDYQQFYGDVAKRVIELDDPDRCGELVAEALAVALADRPGPVVVSMPEDVLSATTSAEPTPPRAVEPTPVPPAAADRVVAEFEASTRPLLLVGGRPWSDTDRATLASFAGANDVPVVAAFRFHDLCDNTAACYVGEAGVAMPDAVRTTLADSDLIVAVGARFGEMTTDQWRLITAPRAEQRIVHVHPSRAELGRVVTPDVAIEASPAALLEAIGDRRLARSPVRASWRRDRRAAFEAALECPPQPGALDLGDVFAWLRSHLPDDVVITNGAGNFTVWPNKYLLYGPRARLLAPQSGAMGYGLPAALAAAAAHPDRTVVCVAGDGDLQMTVAELGTAVQHGLRVIVLVVDNGMYGTIRMHQARRHPGRAVGTELANPDFVALARAYDLHAECVDRTGAFPAAWRRALAAPPGAVLQLTVDPRALTPRQTLDDLE